MVSMPITQARAALVEVVDRVRVYRETVYLTRRGKPVVVMVDAARWEALLEAERTLAGYARQPGPTVETREVERLRRMAAMEKSATLFAGWVKPGTAHPDSASDSGMARRMDL